MPRCWIRPSRCSSTSALNGSAIEPGSGLSKPPTRRLTTFSARGRDSRVVVHRLAQLFGRARWGQPPCASRTRPDLGDDVQPVGVWVQRLLDDLVGDMRAVVVARVDVRDAQATASRSTAMAASRSAGGPNTCGPASCIAPYPMRVTVRSSASANVPPGVSSLSSRLLWFEVVRRHRAPGARALPEAGVFHGHAVPGCGEARLYPQSHGSRRSGGFFQAPPRGSPSPGTSACTPDGGGGPVGCVARRWRPSLTCRPTSMPAWSNVAAPGPPSRPSLRWRGRCG